jgi:hypothetical protein
VEKLRNSELENNVKAAMTGKITAQLKIIKENRQRDKPKVRLNARNTQLK